MTGEEPRLPDEESERRFRQLVSDLRRRIVEALADRRRKQIRLVVMVQNGLVSRESGIDLPRRQPLLSDRD